MTKTTKWHVHPVKTQINLGIWSESLLSAWRKLVSLATHWVHSEDSDQTGQMPRLIWVFPLPHMQFCWFCHQAAQILFDGRPLLVIYHMGRVKRIWYLSPMQAVKVQASLRICTVSPEPSLLAHTSSESRRTFRQKARSLAPLNGWACAVKICHDGMLEDTNSLDAAHIMSIDRACPVWLCGNRIYSKSHVKVR